MSFVEPLEPLPGRRARESGTGLVGTSGEWALRSRETVERLVREATRVVGVYADGRQVGFARAFSLP